MQASHHSQLSQVLPALALATLFTACGSVQHDEPAPFSAPAPIVAAPAEEPAASVSPRVPADVLQAAHASLGVAGLSFGSAILQACPDVVPPRFDYDMEKMRGALDSSLEGLGRCAASGRLAQSRIRLLIWDAAAGEALRALLVGSGTQESRLVLELQAAAAGSEPSGAQAAPPPPDPSPDHAPALDAPKKPEGATEGESAEREWRRLPKVRIEVVR